ncbi:uncharacterized protein LOC106087360 isoform X1 [Stomoxys calcitrans]|uniref:uncharacterized protein LOC106087360 isoform X1 n=1 Tax=Stomoxys calcitrans TaxID=35570 RepID=UPI0027E34350|nr:uncharacterized protein LOC106087360 isoform X1 [Stomoxys calcitrans]XP_059221042.1 uncharacterized protein LOC106087360 isoform X1 [Stomoxys calcitrans]
MKYTKQQHSDSRHHHHHHHHHHGRGGSETGGSSTSGSRISLSLSSSSSKRGKKHNWGTRERSGMSFLIVIAFFAVFGLIILTELFMIDERAHGGMMMMRSGGGYGGRFGDSMPDYDNVKDDYDLLDAGLLNDNKLGFVQLHDNKFKIQDAADSNNGGTGRLAGVLLNSQNGGNAYAGAGLGGGTGLGGGSANGGNGPLIPWGKMLPPKIEDSLPRFPIGFEPTDGSWQIVNGTRFKFFVFSAYYDRRDGAKLVRIVGATKTRGPERVWCRFWYVNKNATTAANAGAGGAGKAREKYTSATVMARVKVIRENWSLKYSACFVLCPVRPQEYDVPQYVSIVARLRAPPGNLLELRNTDWDRDFVINSDNRSSSQSSAVPAASKTNQPPIVQSKFPTDNEIKDDIAICVKPFHFNYDQSLFLMEYLEFYALMGVSHFTFYNHTIGPHANCILDHYVRGDIPGNSTAEDTFDINANKGKYLETPEASLPPPKIFKSSNYRKPTVEIFPWNLRMRSQKEIRTEGLFAALNDCLYRTMYRYKYLALVDLDEFIVPRQVDTLNELLSSLNNRTRNRNTGAYSFQNAFFYLQFADDPQLAKVASGESLELAKLRAALVTQRKTRRRFKLHPQKQRSKYICRPEAVVEAGNHFVWEYAPGKGSLNVPPTDAILQHYRVCEFGGNDCIKAPSIIDRTSNKYINRLVERVLTVYRYLKTKCDLPELPPIPKPQTPKPEMKPIIRKDTDHHEAAVVKRKDVMTKKILENKKLDVKKNIKRDNEVAKVAAAQRPLSKANSAIVSAITTIKNSKASLNETALNAGKTNKTTIATSLLTTAGGQNSSSSITSTSSTNPTTATSTLMTTTTTKETTPLDVFTAKKTHKVVVFFVDDKGKPRARLEYH